MNLDDLKSAWGEYDRKLASTHQINERILQRMITDRSENRFVNVKRYYLLGMLWMAVWLSVGIMIMIGNPFDFSHDLQYVPVVIFNLGLAVLLADYARTYLNFQQIGLTQHNVAESLKRIIAVYEKPRKVLRYVIVIFLFSQVVLLPLSFLPHAASRLGWGPALLERLIPIGIGALMLYAAYRFGAFREKSPDKFREDLQELDSLKRLSNELINS